MKIAIITHYWKNSPGGGVLTYLTGLVDEFVRKGNSINIVFKEGIDQDNYLIKGNRVLFPLKAIRILRQIKPEIVHSQGTWYCTLAGYIYKKISGATLICTLHTSPGNHKTSAVERIIMQFLFSRCDCVTFVSRALKNEKETIERYNFKKTAITYAGISFREISENDTESFRNHFGLSANSIILLAQAFTANKLKAEGAKLLISTLTQLKVKYPDIMLILTKAGVFSDELKTFARNLGLGNAVIFTEDVENPLIPLAVCNIYTHISLSEGGISMAILEAMSMGKPIVATSIGGIPEIIINEENGILINPDMEEIIHAIEFIMENPDFAKKIGANARNTVVQKFSWENSSKTFIDLFEKYLLMKNKQIT